jgi:flagellar protein FliO/FliZ
MSERVDRAPRYRKAKPPESRPCFTAVFQKAPSGLRLQRGLLFFGLSIHANWLLAQGASAPPAPAAGVSGAGSVAASVYAPASSGGGMIWLTFITLLLLAGVILLVAWLVHKNMTATVPNSSIRILSVQTLGPRERIVVASVVGRIFVLGHTASQVNLIAELEPQEVAGLSSSPAPVDFAARLSEILRRAKK